MRQGAEDDVPQRRGDPVAVAVILEVVAHVLLPQAPAELGLRRVMVHVVVGVVVGQVAQDEAREDRVGGGGSEDQDERPKKAPPAARWRREASPTAGGRSDGRGGRRG